MQTESIKHFHAARWLSIFIFMHLVCWTLIPILVRCNLPLDSIEGTIWGHQLEWGYDKNPFLNGWLTALAGYVGGPSGWAIYLFSQLSVAACFWAVWKLARNMLPAVYALIAVMLLEGIQYYNFHAIDFNDNTLELSLWALTSYYFYQALRQQKNTLPWILTGVFAGLGMMAKYYTAALLFAMALFLFIDPENRKQFMTRAPYWGLLTFIIIILPHSIWLFFHDFITVTYVFQRTSSEPSWLNHIFFPAQFAWQQWEAFLPALVLFAVLFIGKKPSVTPEKKSVSHFDKTFLLYVGLGPFLLTILLSLLLGIKLRAGWGMPLLSLWGILLVGLIQPYITQAKLQRFLIMIFTVMGILLMGYSWSFINSSDTSSANFPGKSIAQTITQQWHDTYHTKLEYVAGSRWIGGNIEFYSTDHPAVFIEWDKRRAPWINETEIKQKGAVFVWDVDGNEKLPQAIEQKYPELAHKMVLTFAWLRNKNNLPPMKIGIAFLPPAV